MNRTRLVLLGMNNTTFGPYLAAIHRILISVMGETTLLCPLSWQAWKQSVFSCLPTRVGFCGAVAADM
jgi:hypothetical protein